MNINRLSARQITAWIQKTHGPEYFASAKQGQRWITRMTPDTLEISIAPHRKTWQEAIDAAAGQFGWHAAAARTTTDPEPTHFSYDVDNRRGWSLVRAACGKLIRSREHHGEPTCAGCVKAIAEFEALEI